MMELRPYQRDVIARIEDRMRAGRRRILLVAPTGSGKTVIAADMIREAVERRERVLFLAHRHELIAQAVDKLFRAGIDAGTIKAGFPMRPGQPAQVASVQTLWARAMRTRTIDLPRADLIVVDEAHHCRARTYQKIIESYPNAVIIGMTATPCRSDGRGLGNVFDAIVECPPVQKLIDLRFLVGTKVFAPVRPDLTGVRIERGDYVEKQLAARMDDAKLVGDVVTHWHRLAESRKTVVFATGVAHSVHLRDEFRRSGVWAEHIDGSTPAEERADILNRLSRGEVDVVCNCMVLTEGWDQEDVSCIVLARPTKHMGLYRQMVGRALRPFTGKTDALVLDHAGAVFEHGMVEEPVTWTLDEDSRAENPVHAARGRGDNPQLTACPECSSVIYRPPCPVCGWKPAPKPRPVKVADGELGRIDHILRSRGHKWTPSQKAALHRQLLCIAREKGYRDGWAAHKHREKFGDWPAGRDAEPEPPDPAVRSWVRSRQIAYAKAMAKAS